MFLNLIPPLSDEEFQGLEESILAEGQCRDTIKIWRGIIVDGHNRYAICQKHGIHAKSQKLRFSSKQDAELWIVQNQLGRRNLVNAMRIKLPLHKEALLQEKARQNRKGRQDKSVHVRKIIAKEAGISEQTVYKYMKIRELGTPDLINRVESGKVRISTAHREAFVTASSADANPPAHTAGLEVVTRSVEVLYDAEDPHDISNPICESAVLINLERLAKLYYFILGNAEFLTNGEHMPRIQKTLRFQLSQLHSRCG